MKKMCNCKFDPYPEGDEDFGVESTHYFRTCFFCGNQWFSLHCPHDGYQNECPNCGKRSSAVSSGELTEEQGRELTDSILTS